MRIDVPRERVQARMRKAVLRYDIGADARQWASRCVRRAFVDVPEDQPGTIQRGTLTVEFDYDFVFTSQGAIYVNRHRGTGRHEDSSFDDVDVLIDTLVGSLEPIVWLVFQQ